MCYVNVYTGHQYTLLSGVCYVNVYTVINILCCGICV